MRRSNPLLLVPLALATVFAAAASAQVPPVVLKFDEYEHVSEKRVDTNLDGVHDEFIYYENGEPVRAEIDSDHDGRLDTWVDHGPGGVPLHQERDSNGDGKRDQWIDFENGQPVLQKDEWSEREAPTRMATAPGRVRDSTGSPETDLRAPETALVRLLDAPSPTTEMKSALFRRPIPSPGG